MNETQKEWSAALEVVAWGNNMKAVAKEMEYRAAKAEAMSEASKRHLRRAFGDGLRALHRASARLLAAIGEVDAPMMGSATKPLAGAMHMGSATKERA